MNKLLEHSITSLPVLDKEKNEYVGFFDLFDVFKFLVNEVLSTKKNITEDEVVEIFSKHNLRSVINKLQMDLKFHVIRPDAPIQDAINMMATGIYRLAVYSEIGLESVLSQSRLVRWLTNRPEKELGSLTSQRVMTLPIGSESVIKINQNTSLIDALMTIKNKNISGVAVVDEKDTIVGNVSMSDIKSIGSRGEFIKVLNIPCKEFIMSKIEGHPIPRIVSVKESATLNEVLEMVKHTHVHRVYILSDNNTIKRVITLTDILKLFETSPELLK